MSAAEWWFLTSIIVAVAAALTAIVGAGPTVDRVSRALGHAAVGLVAVGLLVALP